MSKENKDARLILLTTDGIVVQRAWGQGERKLGLSHSEQSRWPRDESEPSSVTARTPAIVCRPNHRRFTLKRDAETPSRKAAVTASARIENRALT